MTATIYFLVWAVLIVLMMRFGCGSHVMGHGGHGHRHDKGEGAGGGIGAAPPAKAVDPVCGMTVDTAKSRSGVFDRHAYFFCSQSCREKFEAAPQTYVKSAASPQAPKEAHHGSH
jgi:YHS domain-containing protein